MKKKYQTKTQLLLSILLDEAEEDLRLSQQRLDSFQKSGDDETWHIEKEFNDDIKDKLHHINWLIGYERNNYSSAKTEIAETVIPDNGERWDSRIYISNSVD